MKKSELQEVAKRVQLPNWPKMTRDDLLEAMLQLSEDVLSLHVGRRTRFRELRDAIKLIGR